MNEKIKELNAILDSLSDDELAQFGEAIKRKIDNKKQHIVYYGRFYIRKYYNTMTSCFTDGGAMASYDKISPNSEGQLPTHKITFDSLTQEFISIEPIDTGVE